MVYEKIYVLLVKIVFFFFREFPFKGFLWYRKDISGVRVRIREDVDPSGMVCEYSINILGYSMKGWIFVNEVYRKNRCHG